MAKTKLQRDVTQCLIDARNLRENLTNGANPENTARADGLIQRLEAMDARTGRRDPTKRKAAKRSGTKRST